MTQLNKDKITIVMSPRTKPKCKAMTGKKAMPAESMRRKYDLQPTLRLLRLLCLSSPLVIYVELEMIELLIQMKQKDQKFRFFCMVCDQQKSRSQFGGFLFCLLLLAVGISGAALNPRIWQPSATSPLCPTGSYPN